MYCRAKVRVCRFLIQLHYVNNTDILILQQGTSRLWVSAKSKKSAYRTLEGSEGIAARIPVLERGSPREVGRQVLQ
jgi:hypothetical protein